MKKGKKKETGRKDNREDNGKEKEKGTMEKGEERKEK